MGILESKNMDLLNSLSKNKIENYKLELLKQPESHILHDQNIIIKNKKINFNNENGILYLSENFINDGKSLLYIAKIIELNNISQEILDYIEFKNKKDYLNIFYKEYYDTNGSIEIIKRWQTIFIILLFQENANIYRCNLIDCITKWLPKYYLIFGIKAQIINNILTRIKWDEQWNL